MTIWICGAVVFLGIFFYKYFKLVRLLRSRSTPDKDLYYWRQKYSLPVYKSLKRVQVRKSELLSSPILVGCIRKTLYLPEMDLEDTDIQFILEHETTHLKRRDLLLKRFYIFVNALHWFNPLMYIAVKKAGGAIESACDFEVVRGKNAETRNRYAELLVYMLQEESQHNSSLFVSLSGNSGYVEQRLSNLADNRRQKRGICVLLAGILIMIILQLFTAVDIHAEPYQNSYLLVQDVEDGVGTVQEIEFRDLYYTIAWIEKEEGEVKRIGDQQDITLRPGQEMHIYLNPEGIPRNRERGDAIVIQFNISEKARLWTGLDGHHGRETTDTHPEVMSGANSNVTTTICIKNYSSETIKIY